MRGRRGYPRAVNPKATVAARFVEQIGDSDHVEPGIFTFCDGYDGTKDVSILFGCPCDCGQLCSVSIKPYSGNTVWQWDGNREKPTLTPSILKYELDEAGNRAGEHWHGFLTAGVFKSC